MKYPEPDTDDMYRLNINERFKCWCKNQEEVWKIIGEQPFGSRHMVFGCDGRIVDEFIPF